MGKRQVGGTARQRWGAGARHLLTPICGLSLTLRRMDYALHLTFINTQPHLPCFLSAASPQGERFGGLGAEPPVKKISAPLCLCVRQICRGTVLWLSDAEQWSGSGSPQPSEFQTSRTLRTLREKICRGANNHRSLKKTWSGSRQRPAAGSQRPVIKKTKGRRPALGLGWRAHRARVTICWQ